MLSQFIAWYASLSPVMQVCSGATVSVVIMLPVLAYVWRCEQRNPIRVRGGRR